MQLLVLPSNCSVSRNGNHLFEGYFSLFLLLPPPPSSFFFFFSKIFFFFFFKNQFNYLVEDGFTYCVVAVESVGRQLPIAFLERTKEDFTKKYGGGKAATAVANSLNREFGPKLKEQMQYCVDHPEEISKLAKVKAQVSEVKGVMMENIEKVLDRGEKIELLVDKTENLRSQAQDFRTQGTKMRRKMWFQNMKIKLIVLGIIIALILIIVLSICGGVKCH